MVEDKETDNMMLKFNTNQIKAVDWLPFLLREMNKIFIQMVLTGYTNGSILSIEVKTTAHDKEKKQMENKNVLDIIDDGVSAFKLTMNGVIIYSSWTLSDCFKHAEWMYRVASQELYWKSGRKVESRKEN